MKAASWTKCDQMWTGTRAQFQERSVQPRPGEGPVDAMFCDLWCWGRVDGVAVQFQSMRSSRRVRGGCSTCAGEHRCSPGCPGSLEAVKLCAAAPWSIGDTKRCRGYQIPRAMPCAEPQLRRLLVWVCPSLSLAGRCSRPLLRF